MNYVIFYSVYILYNIGLLYISWCIDVTNVCACSDQPVPTKSKTFIDVHRSSKFMRGHFVNGSASTCSSVLSHICCVVGPAWQVLEQY